MSNARFLFISAAIALVGCNQTEQQQREQMQREAQRNYDDAFDHCIYRTTGPFSSASIEVIHYCEARARDVEKGVLPNASGMSAGTAETTQIGSGPKDRQPGPNGETPK